MHFWLHTFVRTRFVFSLKELVSQHTNHSVCVLDDNIKQCTVWTACFAVPFNNMFPFFVDPMWTADHKLDFLCLYHCGT